MRTDDFDFDLPPRLIAQYPANPRDGARLLVVRRSSGQIEHRVFRDLPDLLDPGDLLVLNDTRVIRARLLGRREKTGGKWEGLFLQQMTDGSWELLCQTRGRLTEGETVLVEPGELPLRLVSRTREGRWLAQVLEPFCNRAALELLERHGNIPLPPYIRKGKAEEGDQQRYQTVYGRHVGAVAAPTAGLHFTSDLLTDLRNRGICQAFLTLHVGVGTFQPIQAEEVQHHRMHPEWGELPDSTAQAIEACRQRGRKVVAVGTTVVRVLEAVAAAGPIQHWIGQTELFIFPPYQFKAVDALITNFHLPKTSLLVLASAFGGIDLIRNAYREAVEREYRFYSYGDAMLIL